MLFDVTVINFDNHSECQAVTTCGSPADLFEKHFLRACDVEILPLFLTKTMHFFSFSRQQTLFSEFLWTTLPAVTGFVLQLNLYLLLSVVCILAPIPCVLLLCACQAAMCNCATMLLCATVWRVLLYCC